MEYVKSSTIEAISYLKKTKKLRISFKSGAVYQWSRVPLKKYKGLLESESKGRYFSQEIKGRYSSVKIKDKDVLINDSKDFFYS